LEHCGKHEFIYKSEDVLFYFFSLARLFVDVIVLLNALAAKGEGVVIGGPALNKVGAFLVVFLCSRGLWKWQ
jgi:positive regulator of sigma E activity